MVWMGERKSFGVLRWLAGWLVDLIFVHCLRVCFLSFDTRVAAVDMLNSLRSA